MSFWDKITYDILPLTPRIIKRCMEYNDYQLKSYKLSKVSRIITARSYDRETISSHSKVCAEVNATGINRNQQTADYSRYSRVDGLHIQ